MDKKAQHKSTMDRRGFLAGTAVAGATVILAGGAKSASGADAPAAAKPKAARKGKPDDLNVAIIGTGAEGQVLLSACMFKHAPIPGLRFKAMCDIWSYNKKYASGRLKRKFPDLKVFEDYKEMLDDKTLDLDCVIVATPEWLHAEMSVYAMKKGLHVYCEKEMSNDINKAREMVQVSNQTNRLLQIGHQRRSNPRYIHAVEQLVLNKDVNILGRVTQAMAQWNRGVSKDIGWPKTPKYVMPPDKLAKYGYETMHRFRNWRWYKKYGGGPIVDLGSHQIDIFEWVFQTPPKSVFASGGVDYYTTHEWYDNVMCLYEYKTPLGISRAFYQVQTTTSHGGYHEVFMGENGTLVLSENPARGNWVKRETRQEVPDWNQYVKKGLIQEIAQKITRARKSSKAVLDVRLSASLPQWPLPVDLARPFHQPHLANFFEAVRLDKKSHLNCPGEIGFKTAVAVLAANDAIVTQKKRLFDEKEFHA